MCDSKCGGIGRKCTPAVVGKYLLVAGGLNWGLVGVAMLTGGNVTDWNIVHMLTGSIPALEAVVYVLVGLSAVMKLVGCKCKKCMDAGCSSCESCAGGEKKV